MSNRASRRAAQKKQGRKGSDKPQRPPAKPLQSYRTSPAEPDEGVLSESIDALMEKLGPQRSAGTLSEIGYRSRKLADAELALGFAVADAKNDGWSWAVIGDQFGVSRQSARARFMRYLESDREAESAVQ